MTALMSATTHTITVRLHHSKGHYLAENLSMQAACQAVAPKLGVSWHTARQWVQQARRDGVITRVEEDVIAENARLRRENQELRDTNELLKAASAFSR